MGTDPQAFGTLRELYDWCAKAPPNTRVDARDLANAIQFAVTEGSVVAQGIPDAEGLALEPSGWRERLWLVPAETRLGVPEVAEALSRPKSWVYARTGPSAEDPLPHRKLDGANIFTAGELRAWIRSREEVVHAGPMESTPAEREGRLYAV
jgi:hypothetical protein